LLSLAPSTSRNVHVISNPSSEAHRREIGSYFLEALSESGDQVNQL
jgi:hypothetical protein